MKYIEADVYVSGTVRVRVPYKPERHELWQAIDGKQDVLAYELLKEDIHEAVWQRIIHDYETPLEFEEITVKEVDE